MAAHKRFKNTQKPQTSVVDSDRHGPAPKAGMTHPVGGTSSRDAVPLTNLCTRVCGDKANLKRNCSFTMLVNVFMDGVPNKSKTVYCILYLQSNNTLADDRLIDFFGLSRPIGDYEMTTASGTLTSQGREVNGLSV